MIGLFVDTENCYFFTHKKFPNRRLNFGFLYDFVEKKYGKVGRALAYGRQRKDKAENFIFAMKKMGYDTRYREIKKLNEFEFAKGIMCPECNFEMPAKGIYHDWSAGMALDVTRIQGKLDQVILGSQNINLIPVIEHCIAHAIRTVVIAPCIPPEVREAADECVEIGKEFLDEEQER